MMSPARVLVVDDEKLIRWSVGERLTRTGYEVDSAESGEEALARITASPPDLLLLDVRLPGIDGLATLKRALAFHPDLAVLMMSAHSTVDQAVQAMKEGAVDFLVKPFPFNALDAAVTRALAVARTRKQIESLAVPRGKTGEAIDAIVGQAPAMEKLRAMVARLAASDGATVLVEGESGSGKEVVARAIHIGSARAARPFVQLNCAALPEQLLESELFGHERGAFTDARVQKRGLFESTEGGTVFLDEIGELPLGGQAKLLQLLENRTFRRVGGVTELRTEARVLAATNVDLEERVSEGLFRTDLFFRLNVVRVRIPPLREHAEDIPLLAAHFIARFDHEMNRTVRGISPTALEILSRHRWPGNVRELRNVIERALILHPEATELRREHLPAEVFDPPEPADPASPAPGASLDLDSTEKKLIGEALEKTRGNQSQAARLLGISRDTLRYRMKKHGLL